MKVYVCALAKNEHLYINEWVAHYVKLGFDKIYIYDNDDLDVKPSYKFIDKAYNNKVVIVDIRGKHYDNIQGKMYSEFYNFHKNDFDWCLFCDIDEFLTGIDNIKVFLSRHYFKNFEQIRVKWKLFGDDNLIERDMTKGVMETFNKEVTNSLMWNLKDKSTLEKQGKAIVKGHLNNIVFNSVHYANYVNRNMLFSCLPSGVKCNSGVSINEDYSKECIYLNHYMTKSLSEFIKQKIGRGDAVFGKRQIKMDYYWRINKKTKKKIKYLQDMGLEI